MNPKIQEHHRRKPAYIYLRQSTPGQVLHHRESTERQYALREKARELGWSESLIRTLDQDLGKTGTEMTRREDFKTLVADVSIGSACWNSARSPPLSSSTNVAYPLMCSSQFQDIAKAKNWGVRTPH
jgi:Resolvase, N terminal domain